MNRICIILSCLCLIISGGTAMPAQKRTLPVSGIVMDFEPVCDTLDSLAYARLAVKADLELEAVMRRGNSLDFYFSRSLGDLPWTSKDVKWFRSELKSRFPEGYRNRNLGSIFSNRIKLEDLITPSLGFKGQPSYSAYTRKKPEDASVPLVRDNQRPVFSNGLSNRHIALWQSHGRYYEQATERWEWQRPCLFQTAEDLFTQSFVLPYLVPMLENAGAYVIIPRERDIQTVEIITDNDPSYEDNAEGGTGRHARLHGTYSETGEWTDAGTGFADSLEIYTGLENPFRTGTARMAPCIGKERKNRPATEATWTPDIPHKGEYAVYISYKSLPNSTDAARYTVRHLGGTSSFTVNQKIGGGTWIYLGTFTFDKGTSGHVSLDNVTPEGRKYTPGSVVTADAVKIGGGMGNIARKPAEDSVSIPAVSGLPRFVEGARYWMQWSGADTSVYSQNCQKNDYMDDFMSRGAWVGWLSGGSSVNPGQEGLGIPVDIAFGFHSDAGTTPNDSTVGTLAIYTLKCENRRRLPDGGDRMTAREYAYLVQSQIVNDLRAMYDPIWNRRCLWDRSYSESRTPPVPAMLLELMSHQNFADMRYGLDPSFRFTVSRAVYKGMLKYLANRYRCPYVVQPLPVNSFAAVLRQDGSTGQGSPEVELRWKATADTLEPTAVPDRFILYTRIDSAAFDNGVILDGLTAVDGYFRHIAAIQPGHIYSYRITACNSGGESFPSETLSAGVPEHPGDSCRQVLIVNNFTRVSAPASFDTPAYAGFDNRIDSGVPYIRDISFSGEMYQYRRDMPWINDDNPGFGASDSGFAGKVIAGNTFDYPYIHGLAVMKAGYPFCSASMEVFAENKELRDMFWSTDLICGKQVTTKTGSGSFPDRYRVFPEKLQEALTDYCSEGGNVLVSGSKIATDIWDKVYETECDSTLRAGSIAFAEDILGYRWLTGFGSRTGAVMSVRDISPDSRNALPATFSYNTDYSSRIYRVENPDGILPAMSGGFNGKNSGIFLKYADSGIPAGIYNDAGDYRTVILGFPIETIIQSEAIDSIIEKSLKFFER